MNWRMLLASLIDTFREYSERPLERLRDIGLREGMAFLDVGCGLGFYSFAASQIVGDNGVVYALDIDSEYLQHVCEKARRFGMTNIRSRNADATATGLPHACVDIVFVHLVLHDIEDKPAAMMEFSRVLKPGGTLAIDEEGATPVEDIKALAERCRFAPPRMLPRTMLVFKKGDTSRLDEGPSVAGV